MKNFYTASTFMSFLLFSIKKGSTPFKNNLTASFMLFVTMLLVGNSSWAQEPTLGNYSDPSIATAGGNATVSPGAAPTGGASVTAYTTTNFKGLLASNQQPPASHSILIRSNYEL